MYQILRRHFSGQNPKWVGVRVRSMVGHVVVGKPPLVVVVGGQADPSHHLLLLPLHSTATHGSWSPQSTEMSLFTPYLNWTFQLRRSVFHCGSVSWTEVLSSPWSPHVPNPPLIELVGLPRGNFWTNTIDGWCYCQRETDSDGLWSQIFTQPGWRSWSNSPNLV